MAFARKALPRLGPTKTVEDFLRARQDSNLHPDRRTG
jgi:hypothetical protein